MSAVRREGQYMAQLKQAVRQMPITLLLMDKVVAVRVYGGLHVKFVDARKARKGGSQA